MINITGSFYRLVYNSNRFLRNAQYYHIVMAVFMIGTGVTAIVLSNGSNGDAQVPYFFSAFIAGTWHIVSAVVCQVCIFYLSGERRWGSKASASVRIYSILCSVFVLFNVMGVVFTVVNGMCIESQMCYYDKNHVSNRIMAILLILEHCISTLATIILAKRAHLIEAELSADASIKLNTHFSFHIDTRKKSESSQQTDISRSQQTTPENQTESGLSEVQNKGGHVLTTIEISAMAHRKTHRRSKSQPINLKQLGIQPIEIEGQVFSIYSDSESKDSEKRRKKKRRFISPGKTNRIKASIEIKKDKRVRSKSVGDDLDRSFSEDESLSSFGTKMSVEDRKQLLSQMEKVRRTTVPLPVDQDMADEIFYVKPANETEDVEYNQQILLQEQQKLQREQQKLQEEQAKLFEKQRKLFQVQQEHKEAFKNTEPPPYEDLKSKAALNLEEDEYNNSPRDISL